MDTKQPSRLLNRRRLLEEGATGIVALALSQEANAQSVLSMPPTPMCDAAQQGEAHMPSDFKLLEDINVRIGIAESTRDQESYDWFVSLIAPEFAFQRANEQKSINNRKAFLETVKPLKAGEAQPGPRETKVISIDLYGDRAIVSCVVTFGGNKYHNLRMFVRREKLWKLLGWANEQV
jgi:hypothetical protein